MNEFPTTLVIITGVAVVAGAILLLSKKKDKTDDKSVESKDETREDSDSKTEDYKDEANSFRIDTKSSKALVNTYFTLNQVSDSYSLKNTQPDFSNLQLNVGFAFSF